MHRIEAVALLSLLLAGAAALALPPPLQSRMTQLPASLQHELRAHDATWAAHRVLAAATAPGAIVVYDDVWWSPEMHRCFEAIACGPDVTDAVRVSGRGGVTRYVGAAERPAGLSTRLS